MSVEEDEERKKEINQGRLIVLVAVTKAESISMSLFVDIGFCIQLHGIPILRMTRETTGLIGARLGTVLNINLVSRKLRGTGYI